jgi:hypothetical protein
MTRHRLALVLKPAWFHYLLIPRKVITEILNHIKNCQYNEYQSPDGRKGSNLGFNYSGHCEAKHILNTAQYQRRNSG